MKKRTDSKDGIKWYKDAGKNLYVSKGIGTSIFPARFMARAEIDIFNLPV